MCFVEIIKPHPKFVSLAPQRSAETLEGSAPSLPHIAGHRRSGGLHELTTTSPRPLPPLSLAEREKVSTEQVQPSTCFVEIIEPHPKFVSLAAQRSAETLEGSAPSLPHITGHRRSDALHELNTTPALSPNFRLRARLRRAGRWRRGRRFS